MKVRNRYFLNKKKLKKIKQDLGEYASIIPDKKKIEYLEAEPISFILVDGEPTIILINDKPYPTLKYLINNKDITIKKVVVDMGAVKFMANGADVMSPGITDATESIVKDDIVVIVDEDHSKPLAVGVSLIAANEMINNTEGKAVKTLHFIGDDIWNLKI
ncbi:MAG: RNA-binding protein [Methanobrevibacter sp.]|jgi:PUA domain protein|nr:RNA-binding protein [Candidatus Methanovirga australis]